MKIELTKEQYRELLLDVIIGAYIRAAVLEMNGGDFKEVEKLENHLLSFAGNFDAKDMVEKFQGALMPSEKVCKEYEDIMEEYNEDEFWHTLMVRLGQRDFYNEITPEDQKHIEDNNGWLPEKVHDYYRKYDDEFEKYDIDRIVIKKSKRQ